MERQAGEEQQLGGDQEEARGQSGRTRVRDDEITPNVQQNSEGEKESGSGLAAEPDGVLENEYADGQAAGVGRDLTSDVESDTLSSCGLEVCGESQDFDMSAYIPEFYAGSQNFRNEADDRTRLQTQGDSEALSALERRREQKRKSKCKAMDRARAALQMEAPAAQSGKPRRCVPVDLVLYMKFSTRWRCEQYIRAYTAYHGTQNGINIQQSAVRLVTKCRTKGCSATFMFDRQPKTGLWKLNRFLEHLNECSRQSTGPEKPTGTGMYCTPAYIARQVARAIFDEADIEPGVSTRVVHALVKAKHLYCRQPPPTHYRAVRLELHRMMATSRAVDMAALDGYAALLREAGHEVQIVTMDGKEMKRVRVKAARHIFEQCKKARTFPKDAVFQKDVVELGDIDDSGKYYDSFILTPSVAKHMCATARTTCAADAAHCDGIGPQSFGTTFEVVSYDANNQLTPLVFGHSVGPDCYESWKLVFNDCAKLEGFDVATRTTIVDQEKSIDKAYRECFQNAKLFLDPLHVKKNLGPKLGAAKAIGLELYEQAVHAPSLRAMEEIRRQFPPVMREHLVRFADGELYRAASCLKDLTKTSQGAESQMSASLRNRIRACEPQKMLSHVLLTQRTGYLKRQAAALTSRDPVPPYVKKHIASLVTKSRVYQSTVQFVRGTNQMEATVRSFTNGSETRHVCFDDKRHTPPSCWWYSKQGTGFPCLHGIAVIAEKHGSANVHKFIDERNLTSTWKGQYKDIRFPLPEQAAVDEIMLTAKKLVALGNHLQAPKALSPPRGRPDKHAGKRKKGWFEQGPNAPKKRSYSCTLCHCDGHVRQDCQLKQLFE